MATSESEATAVLDSIAQLLDIAPQKVKVRDYPKFTDMYECVFHTRHRRHDGFQFLRELVDNLGGKASIDETILTRDGEDQSVFETIIDVRNGPLALPNIHWVLVTSEMSVST
ncbi:MAG: hypothetical protein DWQ31_01230 [Planctomycetota bacterium]|nr:MAG: hypothetical protein DWQ31_01230 [Planctomycetota bacterium]REK46745.1 MAG: hypothetical protein DWQ46_05965 [Planctomycetota bacterium]